MTLTNPSLIGRVIGSIGEHFAQKKNPRIQTAQAPAMGPARPGRPRHPSPTPRWASPPRIRPGGSTRLRIRTGGGITLPVMPEATSFAPCNTFRSPCKYHGGPCPGPRAAVCSAAFGPGGLAEAGRGYAPAPPPPE